MGNTRPVLHEIDKSSFNIRYLANNFSVSQEFYENFQKSVSINSLHQLFRYEHGFLGWAFWPMLHYLYYFFISYTTPWTRKYRSKDNLPTSIFSVSYSLYLRSVHNITLNCAMHYGIRQLLREHMKRDNYIWLGSDFIHGDSRLWFYGSQTLEQLSPDDYVKRITRILSYVTKRKEAQQNHMHIWWNVHCTLQWRHKRVMVFQITSNSTVWSTANRLTTK